jgi:hypothetical protein
MIVATFREGTPAAGRTVTYDDGVFAVTGAPITADQLLAYDDAGQIDWAYAGLREWVATSAAKHGDVAAAWSAPHADPGPTTPPASVAQPMPTAVTQAVPPAATTQPMPSAGGYVPPTPPQGGAPGGPPAASSSARSWMPLWIIIGVAALVIVALIVAVVVVAAGDSGGGGEKKTVVTTPTPTAPTTAPATPTPTPSPSDSESPTDSTSPTPTPTVTPELTDAELTVLGFVLKYMPPIKKANVFVEGAAKAYQDGNYSGSMARLAVAAQTIIKIQKKWNKMDWVGGNVHQLEHDFNRFVKASFNCAYHIYEITLLPNDIALHAQKAIKASQNIPRFQKAVTQDLLAIQDQFGE